MKVDPESDPAARRVHQRGKKQKASFLAGPKLRGIIQTEGDLEATFAFAAMIDPQVKRCRPQPFTVDLNSGCVFAKKSDLFKRHSGKGYQPAPYTPDFELLLVTGETVFVETKSEWMLKKRPEAVRLPAVLAEFGLRLVLVTDQVLNANIEYNARLLRPYLERQPSPIAIDIFAKLDETPVPFWSVTKQGASQGDVLSAILRGDLCTDISSSRIGPRSLVARADGNREHLEILPL